MKKTLVTLAACLAIGASAYADYEWTGTAGDGEWSTQGNWNLNGATWAGNGPNTRGSDLWDTINMDGAGNVHAGTLEGWDLNLNLTNGTNLTVDTLTKLQTDTACTISIDKTSSLVISNFAVANPDGGSGTTFDVNGKLDINLAEGKSWTAPTVTLGEYGSINVSGGTFTVTTLNLTSTAVNQTITTVRGISVVEREISSFTGLSIENISVDGDSMYVLSDNDITPTFGDLGLFRVFERDGKTFLSYVIEGTPEVINPPTTPGTDPGTGSGNIPEPATTALSLLALAGLAARRRRK